MTAIILILLPGAVLSYLGFVSVNEKTEGLKTSYRETLSLVRDRIEEEVLRLKDALRRQVLTALSNWPRCHSASRQPVRRSDK